MNLKHWRIQCRSKCSLCNYSKPTTIHILIISGYPIALSQSLFTFGRDQVLYCLASGISVFVALPNTIHVYTRFTRYACLHGST